MSVVICTAHECYFGKNITYVDIQEMGSSQVKSSKFYLKSDLYTEQ